MDVENVAVATTTAVHNNGEEKNEKQDRLSNENQKRRRKLWLNNLLLSRQNVNKRIRCVFSLVQPSTRSRRQELAAAPVERIMSGCHIRAA
jgi:hypothetical protein